jgi:hypothetical protein
MFDEHTLDSFVAQYVYDQLTSIIHGQWSHYWAEAVDLPAPLGTTPVGQKHRNNNRNTMALYMVSYDEGHLNV